MGQGQLKVLTEKDYSLWSTMQVAAVSERGTWVSYRQQYENENDTLFVKRTDGAQSYHFAGGENGKFGNEGWFGCQKTDTLVLQDLKRGRVTNYTYVSEFEFCAVKDWVAFSQRGDSGPSLIVADLQHGQIKYFLNDVVSWRMNAQADAILYVQLVGGKATVGLLNLGKKISEHVIVERKEGKFSHLTWDKSGHFAGFIYEGSGEQKLYHFGPRSLKLSVFDSEAFSNFPKDMRISTALHLQLEVSEDGQRVIFFLSEPKDVVTKNPRAVEIWNTDDAFLYEYEARYGNPLLYDKAAVWQVTQQRFFRLCDQKQPEFALSENANLALTFNRWQYEPQIKMMGDRDICLINLLNGKKSMLLKKYSGDYGLLSLSPNGKSVAYVKGGQWYIYDVAMELHRAVTGNCTHALVDPETESPYGIAGWSKDGASFIAYDAYDLWEVKVDGSGCKRLTQGRESGIRFRAVDGGRGNLRGKVLDLRQTVFLEAQSEDGFLNGYFYMKPNEPVHKIVYKAQRFDQFLTSDSGGAFVCVAQSFSLAPQLQSGQVGQREVNIVYQSNSQQRHFEWGRVEKISYTVQSKVMGGLLVYPAGFVSGKRYPMVVSVYEKQSKYGHDYINPSLYNNEGFNLSNFSLQGYFVLLPDIGYELGLVGPSALRCVLAAVDGVLEKGIVDENKIGLVGHSFGGFETNYIVSHSNRFAAAVSGSAWNDFVHNYLSVSPGGQVPEYFRAEHQQQRIGVSLFENPAAYYSNSPVLAADKVETPLLSWAGKNDNIIKYEQSLSMYMALRRAGKGHIMLLYPEETHWINSKANQEDLTRKVEAWFGHYLKGAEAEDWMGVSRKLERTHLHY